MSGGGTGSSYRGLQKVSCIAPAQVGAAVHSGWQPCSGQSRAALPWQLDSHAAYRRWISQIKHGKGVPGSGFCSVEYNRNMEGSRHECPGQYTHARSKTPHTLTGTRACSKYNTCMLKCTHAHTRLHTYTHTTQASDFFDQNGA